MVKKREMVKVIHTVSAFEHQIFRNHQTHIILGLQNLIPPKTTAVLVWGLIASKETREANFIRHLHNILAFLAHNV